MTPRRPILVTGSAGRVATLIAPDLRAAFRLRRLDLAPQDAVDDDELIHADIRDVDAVREACRGVDAIVHLAAQPAEAEFRGVLLERNLDGAWALYEAAVREHVPRVVFASTIQTVQGYEPDVFVTANDPPRPISVYGCTKIFGEALGRYHADVSGLGVACLRLGAVHDHRSPSLAKPATRALWLGGHDLAALVIAAIRSDMPYATVIAVSVPATAHFDTQNPFGWTPKEVPALRVADAEGGLP